MMRRKMISAGLCLALLWMSGCGQKGEPEEFTYFLFATPLKEHETWLKAKTGFQAACSDYGLKCAWEGPAGIDTEMMEEVMETGILQKADAIITQGVVDPDMVREAQAQGIPVVLVDSDIPESDSFAYIGKNFRQQAEMLLEDIESRYGEDEHLVVAIQVAELGFQIAKDQIAAVEEVFSAHRGGYEIVSISQSKSDNVKAKQEWDSVMAEHADINVAINFAGESAASCYKAAEKYDLRDQMLIYGVDEVPEVMEMIRQGKVDGSIVASFYEYGYRSVEMLYAYITEGRKPEERVQDVVMIMVTKENIDTYQKELSA